MRGGADHSDGNRPFLSGPNERRNAMLDLAFYGRTGNPIMTRPTADIERRASWGAFLEDLKFVAAIVATIAISMALVWGGAAVMP